MDYVEPVEALIPGVQGRVLGVLARTDTELTMRKVAELGGVSFNRATSVLNSLVHLGVVERREAGSAALVRLARDNEAARTVLALAELRAAVVRRLTEAATKIEPRPACLVLFGSFARNQAVEGSDIDVLAVAPAGLTDDSAQVWHDALGRWSDLASRIAGNPVNIVEAGVTELPGLLRSGRSVWRSIAEGGILLAGTLPDGFESIA